MERSDHLLREFEAEQGMPIESGQPQPEGVPTLRPTTAAADRLGQIVTGIASDVPVSDGGEQADADELDDYSWRDAAHWWPNGGPDQLSDSANFGELLARVPADEIGSLDDMGRCRLLREDGLPGGTIVRQNPYGQHVVWRTTSNEELTGHWQQLRSKHEAYQLATRPQNHEDERDSNKLPRIWVGSLADYAAGYLHGEWLDATLEPEELERAAQFILCNSHDLEAEEYGIFDYDGFEHGVASLLGECASLKVVSKIAQGIAEHGETYAAWVAYVGVEDETALDQFEDHYLGTYENMKAYVEDVLSETGVYHDLNEALKVLPEDLRQYVQVDEEGLARDWAIELHAVETSSGGVMVFDTRM